MDKTLWIKHLLNRISNNSDYLVMNISGVVMSLNRKTETTQTVYPLNGKNPVRFSKKMINKGI